MTSTEAIRLSRLRELAQDKAWENHRLFGAAHGHNGRSLVDCPHPDCAAVRASSLTGRTHATTDLVGKTLLQLVQEALDAFVNPDSSIDLRDWVKSARAAIATDQGARS